MDVVEMISEAMELPKGTLTGKEALSQIEAWDSLAILNFMALVDTRCGITLSPDKLLSCETVSDIENLLSQETKP